MKTHKDLDVWKFAIDFVTNIYKATAQFPSEEKFGLMSQLRRASVTIPSNIAEGAARNHPKEFIQFLYIALSSAAEIETQLIICKNLNLIDEQIIIKLLSELETIAKMLNGLINSIKNK
jgi:four helix bundle protein